MKFLAPMAIIVGAFSPFTVIAGSTTAQWYTGLTISYVYSGSAGGRAAVGVSNAIATGTCPANSEFAFSLTSPYFATQWSTISIAYTTGQTISIFTDGTCSGNGVNGTDVRLP